MDPQPSTEIVVPYTPDKLRPETAQWAAVHGARMHDVSSTVDAYYLALCEWWAQDRALLVVEHDILPAEGVAEEMLACPEPWCSSPYPLVNPSAALYSTLDGVTSEKFGQRVLDRWVSGNTIYATDALGCTKFSAEFKRSRPTLVVESGTLAGWEPYVWWLNDARIMHLLRQAGLKPHLHRSSGHLSVDDTHSVGRLSR